MANRNTMDRFKFIIPRKDENIFDKIAKPSLGRLAVQVLQIYDNTSKSKKPENIFIKYNAGIEACLQTNIQDDDFVIFMHEDCNIVDKLFKEKLEMVFQEHQDIGLLGVIGTTEITERGGWWMNDKSKLKGHIIQGQGNMNMNEGVHLVKGDIGYFDNIVGIDGLMMISKGHILNKGFRFDNETYEGNDFYDLDACMTILNMGYKVAIADILIYHNSQGMGVFNDIWKQSKERFFEKWTNKGYNLPFTSDQFKINEPEKNEIVEIEL